MTEEPRPALDLESEVPAEGNPTPPGPISVAEKKTRVVRRERKAAAPSLPPPKADRPGLFSPAALYLFGALATAVAWLTYLDPGPGLLSDHPYWPWQLFRENRALGGDPYIEWSFPYAVALVFAFVLLFYLVASLLRMSHGRGAAALLVTLLPIVLLWPDANTPLTYPAGLVAGVVGGAILLRHDRRRLGRGVLFVSMIVLGGMLFFPLLDTGESGYQARVFDLVTPFLDFAQGKMAFGFERIVSADGMHTFLLVALVVLGVLAAFGLRRRWVRIAASIALLLLIVLPVVATAFFGLDNTRPMLGGGAGAAPGVDLLAVVSQSFWLWSLCLTVLFATALASWFGLGGRWATWVAGTALLLLAFDTTGTLYRETLGAPGTPLPVPAALGAVAEHLGQGAYAAFILPVAALVMDLARPRT